MSTEISSASLLDVLAEISDLMEDCSQIAQHVEHAIGDWLNKGADSGNFPVVELQNIDLLRQIQHDLAALLTSDTMAREVTQNRDRVNIAALIGAAKLERVRDRLQRLTDDHSVGAIANGDDRIGSGAVDLF